MLLAMSAYLELTIPSIIVNVNVTQLVPSLRISMQRCCFCSQCHIEFLRDGNPTDMDNCRWTDYKVLYQPLTYILPWDSMGSTKLISLKKSRGLFWILEHACMDCDFNNRRWWTQNLHWLEIETDLEEIRSHIWLLNLL